VVTFDSSLPGTPAEAWTTDGRLSTLRPIDLGPNDRVIVVAAHPDDETLGAGGLIAECFALGIPIEVIVVTDGAASHAPTPSSDPAALAATRAAEARAAVGILAPGTAVTLLGFPDGGIREQRDEVNDTLASLLERSPGTTLLVAPWRGDGHRDHRVVGEICADLAASFALRLLEYPIWMWHWSTPDNAVTPWNSLESLALRPQSIAAKRLAIAAYPSQVLPRSSSPGDEAVLHPRFLRNFGRTMEVFVTQASGEPSPEASLSGAYFDAAYARRPDPWGFETRWYESRKRAITLAALPTERYESAFEIGCSIGVLTELLAERCAAVLAVDISQAAVNRARTRLVGAPHVTVERMDVGRRFPDRHFDLVLLSEVGYYFDNETLDDVLGHVESSLGHSGTLVACHWRHPVDDYPLSGDDVHAAIRRRPGLTRLAVHVEEDFILEVFSPDGRSVAERTGLR
jgi:LmbE family N-acetylglucosaminyl deacetylase/SAM-dependent methyltransferase